MNVKENLLQYAGGRLKKIFLELDASLLEEAEEIRIRANKPMIIKAKGRELFFSPNGVPCDIADCFRPDLRDIANTIELMSNYSLYAFEEELRSGYITLPGGCRIGITGKTAVSESSVRTIKNISGLTIRLSHEIKGCADSVLDYITVPHLFHTMLISPPGCGKTTLLRDIIRHLSDGVCRRLRGLNVGLVDERSEIAGCFMGVPQNDVGLRTDVLDGCPKAEGMMMLLRSASPDVIAVDEIGSSADIAAIENVICGGIKLICTVHGNSIEDLKRKPVLRDLIDRSIFERFVVLSCEQGTGTIEGIYDESFSKIGVVR